MSDYGDVESGRASPITAGVDTSSSSSSSSSAAAAAAAAAAVVLPPPILKVDLESNIEESIAYSLLETWTKRVGE
jgi:hypothetical protein